MSSILANPIATSLPTTRPYAFGGPSLVAVDARNFICAVLAPHNHQHLVDERPLYTFLPQIVRARVDAFCQQHPRLRPLFVLDGEAFRGKARVIEQRSERRGRVLDEVARLRAQGRVDEARRLAPRALRLRRDDLADVVSALREGGYEVHQAPGEAEAQAAHWARLGHVAYVASADRDALLYGAPRVMRGWPQSPRYVALDEVVHNAGASSWRHFVEAFVLAGATSYAPRLPSVRTIDHAMRLLGRMDFEALLRRHAPSDPSPWLAAHEEYLNPVVHPFPLHVSAWG